MRDRNIARARAEMLVAKMTVQEAAEQLRFDAPANERLGIPAYNWWNEALHGVARSGTATSFPQAIGMAASFDPELIETLGEIVSEEGRAKYNAVSNYGDRDIYKGLTYWSPNINIFRDPRWGRGQETYGEDPFLTAELGKAYVRGIQGDGPVLKAAACAKHFAVHSGPEGLRHGFNAKATPKDLEETYLPAFRALVQEAEVEAVMGAYNRTNDEPCCGSKFLLVDTLRKAWGFEGHVVSDCWAVKDFHENHKVTNRPEESVSLALSNGCDVNCGCTYQFVMQAYEEGLITEEQIRTAAVHLFTTRYLLGVMGEGSEFDRIPYSVVECPAHLQKADEATRKGCVLLKNDGVLPFDKNTIHTLGVIGPNADSRLAMEGNYHGTSSRHVTVLEGLRAAMEPEGRVLYAEGCHLWKDRVEELAVDDDRIAEAKTVAANSDAVVVVLGFDETLEGEEGCTVNNAFSGDKSNLLLPESQRKLLRAVLNMGKPTVVVLLVGSCVDLEEDGLRANGLLLGWYPGAAGGSAIADLLFGKASPSGKLPVTFYYQKHLASMPDFTDYSMDHRTYRYYDGEVQYPFGFGLTYGDVFVTAASARKTCNGAVVTVEVCNAGCTDTEDVVQVYCQNLDSKNAPRNPRLCGFQRVVCPAGTKKSLEIAVSLQQLQVVRQDGTRVSEGELQFFAAMGQPDQRTEALTGHPAITFLFEKGETSCC